MPDAKALIESVADGDSPRKAINEGMDMYSMSYKVEDLLSSLGHNIGSARSAMKKVQAFMPTMPADKKKVMKECVDALSSSIKKMEGAEDDLTKAVQAVEQYKKSGGPY